MMAQNENALHWVGEFSLPEKEKRFSNAQWKKDSIWIRIACLLTGMAYLAGSYGDYICVGQPEEFYLMLVLRLSVFALALMGVVLTYRPERTPILDYTIFFYFISLSATESIELLLRPDLANQGVPFLVLIIAAYYWFFPTKLVLTVIGGVSASITYLLALHMALNAPGAVLYAVGLALVVVNLFGGYSRKTLNYSQRQEYRLSEEEKKLRETLQEELERRQALEAKLVELATQDDLTRANNRRHFMELATREFQRSRRNGSALSLLMMDIDHFKNINDTHGHDAGDQVLRLVARHCQTNLRAIDVFGRLGGEEFAALLPETHLTQAVAVAERIRCLIEAEPFSIDQGQVRITVSIGVAMVDDRTQGLPDLLKDADRALYQAKHSGRNRCSLFEITQW